MPYSSTLCKGEIRDWLRAMRPVTVLDVGAGSGVYSRLFRATLPLATWVAVEIHEPYVERFGLKFLYEHVLVSDALDLKVKPGTYDVVLLGDVLEHLTEARATQLLRRALRWSAKGVIVSIPLGDCPQGPSEGNEHEAHLTSWTYAEFMALATELGHPPTGSIVRQDSQYKIGAFLWLK